MPALETDFAWGERYLGDIRRHLGDYLLAKAPPAVDRREATDLLVLELAGGARIACRMRRAHQLERFPYDVTIRLSRPSGARCEFDKVFLDGWADWYFYGFAHPSRDTVAAFRILDLHAFRAAWATGELEYRDRFNRDQSSAFRIFDTRKLPRGVVVKRWIMRGARRTRRGNGLYLPGTA